MKDMQIKISMKCSVCGNDQFSAIDEYIEDIQDCPDDTLLKCSDCGRVTTKEQLFDENSYIIDSNIEDFKDDIIKQVEKDLKKLFK